MKDPNGRTDWFPGSSPFDEVEVEGGLFGKTALSSKLRIPIYDWVADNGRTNIATWIEDAPSKTIT